MSKINTKDYSLSESNYIKEGTNKERIILGNTYRLGMEHFLGWERRWNGKYTGTAMFTIKLDGEIIEHFSPTYYSHFMDDSSINESSITILLENEGWLMRDIGDENKYINYVGHIYNRKAEVLEKRWRNYRYWAPYSEKQVESSVWLIKKLCEEFNIPTKAIGHNTNFISPRKFKGVLYKSNFEKYYTDVSPAWDCKLIKKEIENN
jgi:hypothetical protein